MVKMRNFLKQQKRVTDPANDVPAISWKGLVNKSLAGVAIAAALAGAPAMAASIVASDAAVQISPAHDMNGVRMVNASMSSIISGASATPIQDIGSRLQFANQFGVSKLDENAEEDGMSASRALAILFVALVVVGLRLRAMADRSNRVH